MRIVLRLFATLLCLGLSPAQLWAQQMVVVVNTRSGVAAMTRPEVVNVFFGRNRQFFNGLEVEPVDLIDTHPLRARFYSQLVGKSLADIDAYWSRQIFSGRLRPPPRVNNSEEVIRWVSSHPGGIGFIDFQKADARVRIVYEFSP